MELPSRQAMRSWYPTRLFSAAVAAVLLADGSRLSGLAAPVASPRLVTARSQSGQFVVYAGSTKGAVPAILDWGKNQGYVQLEPNLAAVSCERIKQRLLRELGAGPSWRGTIYLVLYPARGAGDGVTITAERYKRDWQYQVHMPDTIERQRYVRVLTQVLLAEMANRGAEAKAAEIPSWVVEGLTQILAASNPEEIILSPPKDSAHGVKISATTVKGRKEAFSEQMQKKLRGRMPLSFDSLSWPTQDQLYGDGNELYAASAELFVRELLRLPDGRACMQAMLAELSKHYNWQFAFLKAFSASFSRPLDVERWWDLSRAQFIGRPPVPALTLQESWQKLDQALHGTAPVRSGTNPAPVSANIPLQTIVRDWEKVAQARALNESLGSLGQLRPRMASEFVALVQEYQQTILTYLDERDRSGAILPFLRQSSRRRVTEAAIQQLDVLDARRQALRPAVRPRETNAVPAVRAEATGALPSNAPISRVP